ncbi:MAG: hypothetical protein E6G94_06095 [Alphaproteobacteria bacterium]|nr:MAG: hypothetical protein E6G94_06095 [Alphaproteobacteria bacterium]
MSINLHIEKLVLEGLPVGTHEGPLVQTAVEAELARLLATSGVQPGAFRSASAPLVRAEPILTPGADGGRLGTQIGNAIFQEIAR